MKDNNELEQSDIVIDMDIEVDCNIGQEIICYIETRFDVGRKFGMHTSENDSTWLNMYGKLNPYKDSLRIECEISYDHDPSEYFDYKPSETEAQMIKNMITEKIRE